MWISPRRASSRLARVCAVRPTDQPRRGRIALTISDPQIGGTLEEFPLKVVLTPQNFDYAGAASDGVAADASSADLAFVLAGDPGDTQLPYQVDTWKPGGTSVIWVR